MNRNIVSLLIASISALLIVNVAGAASITQKVVTVTVPKDYGSSEAYKVEFAVPDGSTAFNFTLWGASKTWGIADISGGAYKEVYSSGDSAAPGDSHVIDAESSEHIVDNPTEAEWIDPLSRLTLYPGTYVIWLEGKPGTSITLQYNLRMMR
jgi:hypothetical protein